MAKNTTLIEMFRSEVVQTTLQILGVVLFVLNLIFIARLAPFSERLSVLTERVTAFEGNNSDVKRRLERIEDKLDRVIESKTAGK